LRPNTASELTGRRPHQAFVMRSAHSKAMRGLVFARKSSGLRAMGKKRTGRTGGCATPAQPEPQLKAPSWLRLSVRLRMQHYFFTPGGLKAPLLKISEDLECGPSSSSFLKKL